MKNTIALCVVLMSLALSPLFAQQPATLQAEPTTQQALYALANAPMVADWRSRVGARSEPQGTRQFPVSQFGAKADGNTSSTRAIQAAIDACHDAGGGIVTFAPGIYVTGSLFLKSDVHLRLDKTVELLGSLDDAEYPIIHTRAGGVELDWPAALINVRDARNVEIDGGGLIDARGMRYWHRFYDATPEYTSKKPRWAQDYDIGRPQLLEVARCNDVTIRNLTLMRAGFWTLHVLYSEFVTVDAIIIRNNIGEKGPSTDGINVDSSAFVVVQHSDVDCNDDCFSFKAGMNADGQRVGLCDEYVLFHDDIARRGDGVITIGSDMSGGVRHVEAYNMTGIGTNDGVRLKSAKIRGGVVQDVLIHDITLDSVQRAIVIDLNWFPQFSYPTLPTDQADIPPVWRIVASRVDPAKATPHFQDVTITDVGAVGSTVGIVAEGLPDAPLERFDLENIHVQAKTAGSVQLARDWTMQDVRIVGQDAQPVKVTDSPGVTFEK